MKFEMPILNDSTNMIKGRKRFYKKLSYRKEIARRAMSVNSCYVLRGM